MSSKTTLQRFVEKVDFNTATGCWTWLACKNKKGYGSFWSGYTTVLAHRWLWEHWLGAPIDKKMELDHWKMNKVTTRHECATSCVNPEHLRLVTKEENTKSSELFANTLSSAGRKSGLSKKKTDLPEGVGYNGKSGIRACIRLPNGKYKHLAQRPTDTPEHRAELSAIYQAARAKL